MSSTPTSRTSSHHIIFPLSYPLISTKDLFDTLHEPDPEEFAIVNGNNVTASSLADRSVSSSGGVGPNPSSPPSHQSTHAAPNLPSSILRSLSTLRSQSLHARNTGNWPECIQLLHRYVDLKLCLYELYQPEAIVAIVNLALLQLSYASFLAMRNQPTSSHQILIQTSQTIKLVKDYRLKMALKALVCNNYVNLYYKKRKFNAALKYAREAFTCWKRVSCIKHTLYFLFKLACVEMLVGRVRSAHGHFETVRMLDADDRLTRIMERNNGQPVDHDAQQNSENETSRIGSSDHPDINCLPHIEDEPPFDVYFRCNVTGNIEMEGVLGALSTYNMAVCEVSLRKYSGALSHSEQALQGLEAILTPQQDNQDGDDDERPVQSQQQDKIPQHPWVRQIARAHNHLTQISNGSFMTYEKFKMKSSEMVNQGFTRKQAAKKRDDLTEEEKRIMEKLTAQQQPGPSLLGQQARSSGAAASFGGLSPGGSTGNKSAKLDAEAKKDQKLFFVFPHLKMQFATKGDGSPYNQQLHTAVGEWMDPLGQQPRRRPKRAQTTEPQWPAGSPSSIDRSHQEDDHDSIMNRSQSAEPGASLPQMSQKGARNKSSPAADNSADNSSVESSKARKKRKIISRGEPSFMKRIHQKQQAEQEEQRKQQATKLEKKKKKVVRGAPSMYERHKSQLAALKREEQFHHEEEERKRKAKLKAMRSKSPSSLHSRSGAISTRSTKSASSMELKSPDTAPPKPRTNVPHAMERTNMKLSEDLPKEAQKEPAIVKQAPSSYGLHKKDEPQKEKRNISLPSVKPSTPSKSEAPVKETLKQNLTKVVPGAENPGPWVNSNQQESTDFDMNSFNNEIDAMEAQYSSDHNDEVASENDQKISPQTPTIQEVSHPVTEHKQVTPSQELSSPAMKEEAEKVTSQPTKAVEQAAIPMTPSQSQQKYQEEEFEPDFQEDFEQDNAEVHAEEHQPIAQPQTLFNKPQSEVNDFGVEDMEFENDFETDELKVEASAVQSQKEENSAPTGRTPATNAEENVDSLSEDEFQPDFGELTEGRDANSTETSTQRSNSQPTISSPRLQVNNAEISKEQDKDRQLTPREPEALEMEETIEAYEEENVSTPSEEARRKSDHSERKVSPRADANASPPAQVIDPQPHKKNESESFNNDFEVDMELGEDFEMQDEQWDSPRKSARSDERQGERKAAQDETPSAGVSQQAASHPFSVTSQPSINNMDTKESPRSSSAKSTPRRTSHIGEVKSIADMNSANDFEAEDFSLGEDFEDFDMQLEEDQKSQKSLQRNSVAPLLISQEANKPPSVQHRGSEASFGIDAEDLDGMLDDFDDFDSANAPAPGSGDMDLDFDQRLSSRRASMSTKPKDGVVFSPRTSAPKQPSAVSHKDSIVAKSAQQESIKKHDVQQEESFEDDFDFGEMSADLDLDLGEDELMDEFDDM